LQHMHRLRGRLMIYSTQRTNSDASSSRELVLFVELQDVTGALNWTPPSFFFDGNTALEPILDDGQSDIAPTTQTEPQGLSKPRWIVVPFNGSIRSPAGVLRQAIAEEGRVRTIQFGARSWNIPTARTNEYFLSASFTPPKDVQSPLDYDIWSGTLELPPVRLPDRGP
jgi:hypothetical protein